MSHKLMKYREIESGMVLRIGTNSFSHSLVVHHDKDNKLLSMARPYLYARKDIGIVKMGHLIGIEEWKISYSTFEEVCPYVVIDPEFPHILK